VYGSPPLKGAIQREVPAPLALRLLSGGFLPEETIRVDLDADGLTFTPVAAAEVIVGVT
jgi:ATP-dependent Clp protease ATP-binding subunit ClpB